MTTRTDDLPRWPLGAVPHGRRIPLRDGTSTFARVGGRSKGAPAVLLLHGLGASGALNWAGCFEPLAARTRVVAVDHRGHGRGRRVGNRFRLADCADDAAQVVRHLGLGPVIAVGYSMGGPIAQLLAKRHPDLVAGLVLAATSRDFRGRPAERMRFAALGAAAAAASVGPSSLAPPVPALPGRLLPLSWAAAELRRHEPAALLAAAAALGRFSSREWIGELDVPASVIVHERDRLVPPHRQHKLAAALPDAEVLTVDTDHMGVGRDPEAYVPVLLRAHDSVLRRLGAGTARRSFATAS